MWVVSVCDLVWFGVLGGLGGLHLLKKVGFLLDLSVFSLFQFWRKAFSFSLSALSGECLLFYRISLFSPSFFLFWFIVVLVF